jgi:alkylation response protein AidB-like acyl-CoA dehydrogenase
MSPYLSVALAIEALVQSRDKKACDDTLPGVSDGSVIVSAVMSDDGGFWSRGNVGVVAEDDTKGWHLDGNVSGAIDSWSADVLLMLAQTPDGFGIFLVDASASGFTRERLNSLDLTREMSHLSLRSVRARRIEVESGFDSYLTRVSSFALAAYVAEMAGVARKCMEMSVDYAKVRQQFGRPIGSFQAIKHKCAQMLLAVESIDGALWKVSRLAASNSSELALFAAVAKAYASEQCFKVASDNIQIHGGIGFTWEHDAHLYFRRAKALQLLGGDPNVQRAWIAGQIGLPFKMIGPRREPWI